MAVDIERPQIHLPPSLHSHTSLDTPSSNSHAYASYRPTSPGNMMRNRDTSPGGSVLPRNSPVGAAGSGTGPPWGQEEHHHPGSAAGFRRATGPTPLNTGQNGHAGHYGGHHHQRRGSSSDTKETHLSPTSTTFHHHVTSPSHPHFNHSHGGYRRDPGGPHTGSSPFAMLSSTLGSLRSFLPHSSPTLPTSMSHSHSEKPPASRTAFSSGGHSHARGGSISQAVAYVQPETATVRFIALCALWYGSSAMSSNTGKSILNNFRYPVTLTFVQFGFVAFYCVAFLVVREKLAKSGSGRHGSAMGMGLGLGTGQGGRSTLASWGIQKPNKTALYGTTMMSFFQIAGHIFSSMAIARVPVSTVHTIKALSPLFTVASYALLFGVRYSPATYTSLFPLTIGVMLACSFDLRANAFGFLCALGSTIIFVSQNIFSKKLLPKESSHPSKNLHSATPDTPGKLDKLHLLLYSSGTAFVFMIPIWIYTDAVSLISLSSSNSAHLAQPATPTTSLLFSFFLNGTVHFGQNLLAFSILARTSPVTYSIASLVKRIAVICIAIVWFGQSVHGVQGLGIAMTFGGLWMYNRAKGDVDKGERKRGQVERMGGLVLPTTKRDVQIMEGITPPASGRSTPLPPGTNGSTLERRSPKLGGAFELGSGFPHQQHGHYHPHPASGHAHQDHYGHASSAYAHVSPDDHGAPTTAGGAIGSGARNRAFSGAAVV